MAEEKIDPLFKLLIERTRILATVCDNAAETLSEDFKDMVTGPLSSVQDVLKECPEVGAWDGSFSDEDIIIESFRHESQPDGPGHAVRIRHVPTDLAIASYTKRTTKENELVARKALADMVRKRWEEEQGAAEPATEGPRPRRRRSRA